MTPLTIHLDIQTFAAYQRLILKGIISYRNRLRPAWQFASDHWPPRDRAARIRELSQIAGVISHHPDGETAAALKEKKIPVVLIEDDPARAPFPVVNGDNEKIARLAFGHLRKKGLRVFAVSTRAAWPMGQRRVAFERAVREAGEVIEEAFVIEGDTHVMSPESLRELGGWLKRLPKPVGVFATTASEGWRIVRTCNELGIRVPSEVAVMGCDKDQLTCDLIDPALSTIDHAMELAGYEAARLLHRWLEGEKPPAAETVIAPVGVIERPSTDILAIEDSNVREALYFIREAALRGITPGDVVNQVLVGRRRLEIRFKELVGQTIQQQIILERLNQAKHLLTNTDLPLAQIARRCCFEHASRLSESFTRVVGAPPSVYRKRYGRAAAREGEEDSAL